jgi:hypothetical protein
MPDKPKCVGHVPLKDDNGVKLRDEHGKVQTRPCRMRPINGGTVCGAHGGSAKRVKEAAARRYAEQQAEADIRLVFARLKEPGVTVDNPLEELRKLAGEVVLWKDLAAELVADLREYRHTDGRGAEQLRSEIAVLERAFDRCNTVLATIARLNIDERLMVITEAQAELVLTAIDAALTFAAVPADQLGPARLHAVQYLKTAS